MRQIISRDGFISPPEGDIIITTGPLVGLGDHAVYSTLAKRFAEQGRRVYLDKDNRARNDEIMDLFWGRSPYIADLTDRKPNAGYVRQGLFYEVANRYPIGSIEAMERAHGLPPPYSIAPIANYEPCGFHIDLSKTVLIDFSAVSSKIGDLGIAEALRVAKGRFRNAPMLQLLMPKWASLLPPRVQCDSLEVESIYQYLDMLHACRAWVGSEAGGQSLAAAARGEHDVYDVDARPEVLATLTPKTFNSRGYTYRGVDYRVTSTGQDKTGDYFFPHEVTQHVYEQLCAQNYEQMRSRA